MFSHQQWVIVQQYETLSFIQNDYLFVYYIPIRGTVYNVDHNPCSYSHRRRYHVSWLYPVWARSFSSVSLNLTNNLCHINDIGYLGTVGLGLVLNTISTITISAILLLNQFFILFKLLYCSKLLETLIYIFNNVTWIICVIENTV